MVTKLGICFHTWKAAIFSDAKGVEASCITCHVRYSMTREDAEDLVAHLLNVATDFAPGTLSTYLEPHEAC
jgi:hypothetical protein